MDNNAPPLGWLPEYEEQHHVEVDALSLASGSLPCELPNAGSIPDELTPDWFEQLGQGPWPFCHAHMITGIESCLAWLETKGGSLLRFSRSYAAIRDMDMDGNSSRPEGASIGGSIRSSVKYGGALESLMPYFRCDIDPRNLSQYYSNKIPAGIDQDASKRHVKSVVPGIRSFSALDAAQVSGRTAIGFGMNWYTGDDAVRGVSRLLKMPGGTLRGGHALFFFGWKTFDGVRWPYLHNSHDGWGIKHRCLIEPSIVDRWLRNSTFGAYAVTNIALGDTVTNQSWDWVTAANFQSQTPQVFS